MNKFVALVLAVIMTITAAVWCVSYAEMLEDGENVMASLSDEQRNSVGVLNYLSYLTLNIENQKNNRLYLEQAYSALYNNTYMNAIDEVTLSGLRAVAERTF